MGPEAALCPYGPRKPARRKRSTQPGAFFPARFWKRNKRNVDEGGKCKAVGSVEIDGRKYTRDVILDRGKLRKRRKKPSREFREAFGHTPVSLKEEIPWGCKRLVVGTGMLGRLPVTDEVKAETRQRGRNRSVSPARGGSDAQGQPRRHERHLARHLLSRGDWPPNNCRPLTPRGRR